MADDVTACLRNIVKRHTGFEYVEQLLTTEKFSLVCLAANCSSNWVQFQRRLLCDIYDQLCILRGVRDSDQHFKIADRGGDEYPRGAALDRVIASARDQMNPTSLTVRLNAYRRAWMYFANRPESIVTPATSAEKGSLPLTTPTEADIAACVEKNFPTGNGLSD